MSIDRHDAGSPHRQCDPRSGGPGPTGPQVWMLHSADAAIVRMRHDGGPLGVGMPIPCVDAFSVIVQRRDFTAHRLWKRGRLVFRGGHAAGTLAITHLGDEWRCAHDAPFDNVRVQLPAAVLQDCAREAGLRTAGMLRAPPGTRDPVVTAVVQSLLPALTDPACAAPLFVDEMVLTLQQHLLRTYGGAAGRSARTSRLSAAQHRVACEFLAAHPFDRVSVAAVAEACGLSRSHFTRAFLATTGRTPHQWMLAHRLQQARSLLLGPLTLAQIASACGFADQSHLTRVFRRVLGTSPGAWRRSARGSDESASP